jgi:hypothetical protein
MSDTEESSMPSSIKYSNGGFLIQFGKELLKMAALVAAGYIGATVGFTNRLNALEASQKEFLYIQCNGFLPPRARAAVTICRQIPNDPSLRALMRDTL